MKKVNAGPDGIKEMIASMDAALVELNEGNPTLENDPGFLQELMKVDFLEEVHQAMEAAEISPAELARRMGVSRARVAKILNETKNFQMETMARMAAALNREVAIRLLSPAEVIVKRSTDSVARVIERIECDHDSFPPGGHGPSSSDWRRASTSRPISTREEMLA